MNTVCQRLAIAVLFSLFLAGCSVGMALSGNSQKDTSILFVGAPRTAVIDKLGQPETSTKDAEGRYVDSYRVTKGNAPSAGRESTFRALIHYDAEQKVREVRKISVE